jgi:hypothetical protein
MSAYSGDLTGTSATNFTEVSVSNLHGIGVDVSGRGGLAGLQGSFAFTDSTYDGTLH